MVKLIYGYYLLSKMINKHYFLSAFSLILTLHANEFESKIVEIPLIVYNEVLSIASKKSGEELKIPAEFSRKQIENGLSVALWNSKKTAAIISIHSEKKTFIAALFFVDFVLIKAVDISRVERMNLAKTGFDESHFNSISTQAKDWINREDDLLQVTIGSEFVDSSGKSSKTEEKLIFKKGGIPVWR